MLNLVPKRAAAVSLLRGKRPLQRIQVGSGKHQLELPQSSVDALYSGLKEETEAYHNKDFQALPWKDFFKLKLSSFYLLEAASSPHQTKSALTNLSWFGDLAVIHKANAALAAADATAAAAAAIAAAPPVHFPMRKDKK